MQPGVPVVMIMTISVKRECPFPDGGVGGGSQKLCHRAGHGENESEIDSTGDLSQF